MSEPSVLGLDGWLEKLSSASLPIFSETVRAVSGVVSKRETSAHDLAAAIGQDPSLSARLLKIANSPLFNLQHRNIDTIRSAVVLLGFDAVRDLAVSLSIIERVLKGRQHDRVIAQLARSFHAAAQARAFAYSRHDPGVEEVFVAALLLHIGEMAFWSVADAEAAAIDGLTRSGVEFGQAQDQVLGFRLPALTARLVEEWQLGGLLEASLADDDSEPRVGHVRLGHAVAGAVEAFGWESAEAGEVLEQVAGHLDLPRGKAMELVKVNVEEAGKIAARYGVASLERYLLVDEPAESSVGSDTAAAARSKTPDPAVQLSVLQDIASHLEGTPSLDELVHLILRGICDGAGFDQAFFALLSSDRSELEIRCVHGGNQSGRMSLDSSAERNLFSVLLETRKALLVSDEVRRSMGVLFTADIDRWLGKTPFVVMPVVVGERAVGLLCADNAVSNGNIDDTAFAAFRHFGQQISFGLTRSDPMGHS